MFDLIEAIFGGADSGKRISFRGAVHIHDDAGGAEVTVTARGNPIDIVGDYRDHKSVTFLFRDAASRRSPVTRCWGGNKPKEIYATTVRGDITVRTRSTTHDS